MAAISNTLGEIWDYQKSLDSKVKINIVAAPAMILTYMYLFDEYGIQNAALGMLAMSLAKAVLQFS